MNKIITFILCSSLLGVGCANSLPQNLPNDVVSYNKQLLTNQNAPLWVVRGNGAFNDDSFYGVGSASGLEDPSVLRQIADDRARNDLIKLLALDSSSLMKDYRSKLLNDEGEKETIEIAIRTMAHSTLAGITIIDHWEHPRRNEFFSLARLDVNKFEKALYQVKSLNRKVYDSMLDRTAELNKKLEVEIREKEERLTALEKQIEENKRKEQELNEQEARLNERLKQEEETEINWEVVGDYAKFIGILGLAFLGGSTPQ